jgi:hypothetical protein
MYFIIHFTILQPINDENILQHMRNCGDGGNISKLLIQRRKKDKLGILGQ